MKALKFRFRKHTVVVTTHLYPADNVVRFSISYAGCYVGYLSFVYNFDTDLIFNPTDDFLRVIINMVKSFIAVQFYGSSL